MASSQKFAQETELSQRIRLWEERVEPLLQEQARTPGGTGTTGVGWDPQDGLGLPGAGWDYLGWEPQGGLGWDSQDEPGPPRGGWDPRDGLGRGLAMPWSPLSTLCPPQSPLPTPEPPLTLPVPSVSPGVPCPVQCHSLSPP